MTEEDEKRYRRVPSNVIKKWQFLNIPIIRWIEAAIYILLTKVLIWATPFVPKIKIICFVVISAAILALSLHGIKNRSLLELIYDMLRERQYTGIYRLQNINERKKGSSVKVNFENESRFERLMKNAKRRFKEFDEKYDS